MEAKRVALADLALNELAWNGIVDDNEAPASNDEATAIPAPMSLPPPPHQRLRQRQRLWEDLAIPPMLLLVVVVVV